jgi:hypothetical protein
MTDAGAIYTEKNPEARGTSISDNFFDSIGVDSHASIASVYFDAGAGGATIDDNVFFKAGSIGEYGFGAIHINGGTNNTFAGNYFIQCDKAFSFTRWGNPTTPALNTSDNTLVWQVNTFSTGGGYVHKNTVTVTRDPGFEDAAHGNFMLKKAPEALEQAADWKPIPFNKIGIIEK